jgi:hypothetical protein
MAVSMIGSLQGYYMMLKVGGCHAMSVNPQRTVRAPLRAGLTPVYEMIFRRLKNRGCGWIYHFPTLHAIDFRPLRDALKEKERPERVNYSPEEAFAKEREEAKRDKELAELHERLDEGNREAMAEAAR